MSAAKPETWVLTESENKEYFLDEWYIDSDSFADDEAPGMVAIVNGEANARLITAAPETAEQRNQMLEVVQMLADCWPSQFEALRERARRIIAKGQE